MKHLLFVDDEEHILKSLKRELRSKYSIECFTSAKKALARSSETHFDLIISDLRMPEMDGIQFLTAVKTIQPDAIRLILSGFIYPCRLRIRCYHAHLHLIFDLSSIEKYST